MAATSRIIDLRHLLAERFPHPALSSLSSFATGLGNIDNLTGGGFPKGGITEIVAPMADRGSATLLHAFARRVAEANTFWALVDGRDSLDPQSLGQSVLPHLLWVRCGQAAEAIKATDLLLRDQNFPLVVLDLVLNHIVELRRIPQTNWYRLQRLIEATSTALVVLARQTMVSSAKVKLVLQNQWDLEDLERDQPSQHLHLQLTKAYRDRVWAGAG